MQLPSHYYDIGKDGVICSTFVASLTLVKFFERGFTDASFNFAYADVFPHCRMISLFVLLMCFVQDEFKPRHDVSLFPFCFLFAKIQDFRLCLTQCPSPSVK